MHSSFHQLPHFLSRFIVPCGLAKNGRGEQSRRRCFKRQRSYCARRLYLRITSWPLRLACDVSPFSVGAVLSQVDASGKEHPIGFVSRALATAERNYCQFEKEALAVVYGVKHFNNYLNGQRFTLITDHRPLLGVFGTGCRIPDMASARMIRWCLMLQDYTYDLVHKAGERHQNADALSRLPCDPHHVSKLSQCLVK